MSDQGAKARVRLPARTGRVGLLLVAVGLASVVSGCDSNPYRESVRAPPSALTALRFAPNGDPQVWIATCGMALHDEVRFSYAPVTEGGDVPIWGLHIKAAELPRDTKSVVLSPAPPVAYESTEMAFDASRWAAARALGAVTVQVGGDDANGNPYALATYQFSAVTTASPDFVLYDGRHKSLASLNGEARDYCAATAGSSYSP